MKTNAEPKGFVDLSATDRELCDAIRRTQAEIAALPAEDPAIYAKVAWLNEMRQDLIWSRRRKAKR